MKSLFYLYLPLLAALLLLFTSCEEDDVADPSPEPQVLNSIRADTALEDLFSGEEIPDYYVNDDIIIDAKLTIAPGVIIAVGQDKMITVTSNGSLIANGTGREGMISFRGKTQTPGFWRGILINSQTGQNKLDHVQLMHTGSREVLSGKKAAVALFGGNVTNPTSLNLIACWFHQNAGYGLYVEEGARLEQFTNNAFEDNGLAGIVSAAEQVYRINENTSFEENGSADVEVYSSTIKGTGVLNWAGFKYRITAADGLLVKGGWKIAPGASLEFANNTHVRVDAAAGSYINAVGTANSNITFTAIDKQKGAWKGIAIYSAHDSNLLEHVEITYGGSTLIDGQRANLYVLFDNKVAVRNSKIGQSAGYGIYLSREASINNDFADANEFVANTAGTFYKSN
ncbi:hypothetical protein [Cesiribacter sp. SM1]|uniref:hypothetical protein n=1 Tax=Cesiribacter sp. SM1 TaxID=2861196 RepID=UPI001CD1F815|nr:hypothetical protein [Cesiribacter sp. SM1]